MNRDLLRQSANVAALLLTLVMNALASLLPLAGRTTGEVSDRFPVLFVPAGYVFSIWGLIYLGLIAFAIYQALPAQRDNPRLRRIGYLFVASCLFNSLWLVAWHNLQITLSLLLMVGLLLSLIALYLRLQPSDSAPVIERWTIDGPFSLYLGWLTVATVANTTAALYNAGWGGWGLPDALWGVITVIAALIIALLMLKRERNVVFVLVVVWALIGIFVRQQDTAVMAYSSLLAAALLLGALVLPRFKAGYAKPR